MQKKYEITRERSVNSNSLYPRHRIRALRSFGSVKAGDLGGFIQSEKNLSHEGNCWVADDAEVFGNAVVKDDAFVWGESSVFGNATVHGKAQVGGNAVVRCHADIGDEAVIDGRAFVTSYAKVADHAVVEGHALLKEKVRVFGNAHVFANAVINRFASVSGTASVAGSFIVTGYTQLTKGSYNGEGEINERKVREYTAEGKRKLHDAIRKGHLTLWGKHGKTVEISVTEEIVEHLNAMIPLKSRPDFIEESVFAWLKTHRVSNVAPIGAQPRFGYHRIRMYVRTRDKLKKDGYSQKDIRNIAIYAVADALKKMKYGTIRNGSEAQSRDYDRNAGRGREKAGRV